MVLVVSGIEQEAAMKVGIIQIDSGGHAWRQASAALWKVGKSGTIAVLGVLGVCAAVVSIAEAGDETPLLLKENMEQLRCELPSLDCRVTDSGAPGNLFYRDEPVNLKLSLKKLPGEPAEGRMEIEIQEIGTRTPGRTIGGMEGFTDTAGHAPLIELIGKPLVHRLDVRFGDREDAAVDAVNLPLPQRHGTYALILCRNGKRQFISTVCRVPRPREDATIESTPIFGEGQFIDEHADLRARQYQRMGICGWRSELSWSERPDGQYEWERYDRLFSAAKSAGCRIMVTLGGHPWHFLPFNAPTPAARWTPQTRGYWGTADWLCHPDYYERYGKWVRAFCERYWENGKGALWGLENFNEPWEGGGISGWARDCVQYRVLQKLIGEAARSVSPDIRLLAASSIMNTEDKFYSDGSREFDKWVDIFTDHYVVPVGRYGPMVARAHGKSSMETETWIVNSEYMLPQVVCQFLAAGQARIAPWHPRVLFDSAPGCVPRTVPTPTAMATAALNWLLAGKPFEKIVFHNHLPWVFQFGRDDDPDGLLVVFGRLLMAWGDSRERPMVQVEAEEGGWLEIDNRDRLLSFLDTAANPIHEKEKTVRIPLSVAPLYIRCPKGPGAAAARLKAARISGKRPVEILPRDFDRIPAAGVKLAVAVHNCLTGPLKGRLIVTPPDGIAIENPASDVALAAGEARQFEFVLASARPNEGNAYPFCFRLESDAGTAEYREILNAAIAPRGSKTVDGNLDDWEGVAGITIMSGKAQMDPSELMRRPWLALSEKATNANFAVFRLAWDEENLYVSARVHDATPQGDLPSFAERDENAFFHTAASDSKSPYKEFIEEWRAKNPNAKYKSFADVSFVYCSSPEAFIPFRRDRLQIALDVTDEWHDLKPTTNAVPLGFHAWPDTDYEYSIYLCAGGKAEIWRQLAPGVPRIHDFPRQPRGNPTTGLVPGAKAAVKLEGNVFTYEVAIPKSELAAFKLAPGTSFGLMVRAGDNANAHADYGVDKAVTKLNGLTLHPYWERSSNCGVRWTLVE